MPEPFLLQTSSVVALTQVILSLVVTVYLATRRHKSRSTWALVACFAVMTVGAFASDAFVESLTSPLPPLVHWLDSYVGPLAIYALLVFSYAFLADPYPRESRLVLIVAGAAVLSVFVTIGVLVTVHAGLPFEAEAAFEALNLFMLGWAAAVLFRKERLFTSGGDGAGPGAARSPGGWFRATKREASALRIFGWFMIGIIPMTLHTWWSILGDPPGFTYVVKGLGMWFILLAFVVIYVNHAPEATTFNVKLVGVTLAIVLGIVGVGTVLVYPDHVLREGVPGRLPPLKSMRFIPKADGGYRIVQAPLQLDSDRGEDLNMHTESDRRVPLGFEFPFQGTRWSEMYVDSNGLVAFGEPYLSIEFQDFHRDPIPKIAPLYRALLPEISQRSGVFYRRDAEAAVVTWYEVGEYYDRDPSNRNTFQLVLRPDGVTDFVYERVDSRPINGVRGIRPPGRDIEMRWGLFAEPPVPGIPDALLPAGSTIRFVPAGGGSYGAHRVPSEYVAELGDELDLRRASAEVIAPVGFPFRFFDTSWDSAFVSRHGALAFGGRLHPPTGSYGPHTPDAAYYRSLPMVAPLFRLSAARPEGRVFRNALADRTLITWQRVTKLSGGDESTFQVALHRSGVIDFSYAQVGTSGFSGELWGLRSGGAGKDADAVQYLSAESGYEMPGGVILAEDFGRLTDLTYRRYVHEKMSLLVYLTLAATALILVVLPLFFRISVTRPLSELQDAARRVGAGDLDVPVPVRVRDEFGTLAEGFNHMMNSLAEARSELRSYATRLEARVAERTKDLEESLRSLTEAQDQLVHAEKMASLGQLTAGIAHELRNPLNFVLNFSELSIELGDDLVEDLRSMQQDTGSEAVNRVVEDLKEILDNASKIHQHGERASEIVRNMLDHSSGASGDRQATDVNALLREYLALTYHSQQARTPDFDAVVETHLDEGIGPIQAVPRELGRVFANLLNNAFYAVREKHREAPAGYEPTVRVRSERVGGAVEVRVSDNGKGVDPAIRSRIFDPFFTTKPTGTGTGLGLSLAFDIINLGHGGTLTLEADTDGYTTFLVTLPGGKGARRGE